MENKLKQFLQRILKKKIFGTLDTWSTIHFSQRTNEPVFYIVD